MTSQQFTALQTELAKSQYSADIAAGNLDNILQTLNALTIPGDHYISSEDLWNALASFNGIAILLQGSTSSNATIAAACQQALEVLRHSNIQQYRYENSEIQNMINAFQSAGLMTSAQVTQFQSAFTQSYSNVASGIFGRDATLQDLWDYMNMNGGKL